MALSWVHVATYVVSDDTSRRELVAKLEQMGRLEQFIACNQEMQEIALKSLFNSDNVLLSRVTLSITKVSK